jgi:hypothetical protein
VLSCQFLEPLGCLRLDLDLAGNVLGQALGALLVIGLLQL